MRKSSRSQGYHVFDVSQTEGEELPEAPTLQTAVIRGFFLFWRKLPKTWCLAQLQNTTGSHHGTSYGGLTDVDDRLNGGKQL